MFHDHRTERFHVHRAEQTCIERDAIKHWDMGLTRRTAEYERSKEIKSLLSRIANYLGDLAESRHSAR